MEGSHDKAHPSLFSNSLFIDNFQTASVNTGYKNIPFNCFPRWLVLLHRGTGRGLQTLRVHTSGQRNVGLIRLGNEWMASLCLKPSITISETSLEILIGESIQYFHWRKGQRDDY